MKSASLPLLKRREFIALFGGAAVSCPIATRAQRWPSQVVRIICPIGRWRNRRNCPYRRRPAVGETWGQQVVVENKTRQRQHCRRICRALRPRRLHHIERPGYRANVACIIPQADSWGLLWCDTAVVLIGTAPPAGWRASHNSRLGVLFSRDGDLKLVIVALKRL
jgi:hypothetical protein